jgi:hypothetical protein
MSIAIACQRPTASTRQLATQERLLVTGTGGCPRDAFVSEK